MCRPTTEPAPQGNNNLNAAAAKSLDSHQQRQRSPKRKEPLQNQTEFRQPPPVYFKWGRLRFGFHGIWAIFTVVITLTTFCAVTLTKETTPTRLILSTILANAVLAVDATSLIDQVPQSTVIASKPIWIVAPHKEAFQRTMAVMHYLNLRLSRQFFATWFATQWVPLYVTLSLYCWSLFWPFSADFKNGNTYFFVLPMFGGVTLDLLLQGCFFTARGEYLTTQYLLGIQLSALAVAFAFTLAFRGYVSIRPLYFGSAAVLGCLLVGVIYQLLINSTTTTPTSIL